VAVLNKFNSEAQNITCFKYWLSNSCHKYVTIINQQLSITLTWEKPHTYTQQEMLEISHICYLMKSSK